jgi:hypothetical protein
MQVVSIAALRACLSAGRPRLVQRLSSILSWKPCSCLHNIISAWSKKTHSDLRSDVVKSLITKGIVIYEHFPRCTFTAGHQLALFHFDALVAFCEWWYSNTEANEASVIYFGHDFFSKPVCRIIKLRKVQTKWPNLDAKIRMHLRATVYIHFLPYLTFLRIR